MADDIEEILDRDKELSKQEKMRDKLFDIYKAVEQGFIKQGDRANNMMDYWDIYNCVMSTNQFYSGNAKLFVPIVNEAIEARVTRFTNQVFPETGRSVEVVTGDAEIPHGIMALMDHYVTATELRAQIVPAILRNGDIEGQWNVYVSWNKNKRYVTYKEQRGLEIDGMELPEVDEIDDIRDEVLDASMPEIEVLSDADVLVWPQVADTIEKALCMGGGVALLRRWTKADLKRMAADGEMVKAEVDELIDTLDSVGKDGRPNMPKKHVDAAGINEAGKFLLGYEVWTKLEIGDGHRICRAYFANDKTILGCKVNPYWCDLVPVISGPVKKIGGSFKGISQVKYVQTLQYAANDFINEGADSATYALMPIVMTDPLKNPRSQSMVLDLGAVWETSPNDTKFANFPQLWSDGLGLVAAIKSEIFQSLGVNPAMITNQTGGKAKRNQAEVALEQQIDVLTTSDVVTSLEAVILTPLLQRFAWYDAQFRDKVITVKAYGRAGMRANMEDIEPLQMGTRYWFQWLGVEQARTAAQVQQQIAAMNVLRGIPPEQLEGRKLDLVPLVERLVENVFGPRLAPMIFKDIREELAVDPEEENNMLDSGFDLPVSIFDDDMKHMQVHNQLMPLGDPHGVVRAHMTKHQMQMSQKQQAAAQQNSGAQQKQPGQPGVPGGAGPGVAGTPRPGAQPAMPKPQGPPGMIHKDRMPLQMPRKM